MYYKKIVFFLIISFIVFLQSCSDDPASIGSGLLQRDLPAISIFDSVQDNLPQYSKSYETSFNLGSANNILLGKAENVEALTLINFILSFPDTLRADIEANNVLLNSVKLQMTKNYTFGNEASPFNFTAHKINSDWNSSRFNKDSLAGLQYDESQNLITSSSFTNADTIYTVELDNSFILDWLVNNPDSLLLFNGILLKPTEETSNLIGFQAVSSSFQNYPILIFEYEKNGVQDTIEMIPLADVSVVTGTVPTINPEELIVQSGLVINSHLYFDLSGIPANAIITDAELTLTLDTVRTITGTNSGNTLSANFLQDSTRLDSLVFGSVTLNREGGMFTGIITSFIQLWLNGESNEGIVLIGGNILSTVDLFILKGSSAVLAERPRLKIIYTTMK